jgi:hypothetical protein
MAILNIPLLFGLFFPIFVYHSRENLATLFYSTGRIDLTLHQSLRPKKDNRIEKIQQKDEVLKIQSSTKYSLKSITGNLIRLHRSL